MSEQVLQERAEALLALHVPGNPVILPTVWDAWSAKLAVDAGFAALTVGSHPVADSVGKPDGEGMSFDDLHHARRPDHRRPSTCRSRSTSNRVTAKTPQRLIDGTAVRGRRRAEHRGHRAQGGQAAALAGGARRTGRRLREAADAAGVHVVINARTDLFLRQDGDEADRVDRAIARLKLAADAGADSLYPVGRHDPDTLRRLADELPLPINAIAIPDQDDPASFGPLGVGRISFGPFLQRALSSRAEELLARWR